MQKDYPRNVRRSIPIATTVLLFGSLMSCASSIEETESISPIIDPGDNNLVYETPTQATNGWGPFEVDRSNGEQAAGDGRVITIGGIKYAHGFGVHAGSSLTFKLRGACTSFTADFGVDDEVGNKGSVVFQVFVDGNKLFDSGVVKSGRGAGNVTVPITNKNELRLVVNDAADGNSFDHADWAAPMLRGCHVVPTCELQASGPVVATRDGQVIENLRITADGVAGILVQKKNVIVRNVVVVHRRSIGISLDHADGTRLENVVVEHAGSPASGPNSSSEFNNIRVYQSANVEIAGARLSRGSSGIYLQESPSATLTQIEGYDFRGPFPRGQLVQFNQSDSSTLAGFSVVNGHTSWPEDNVNIYRSGGVSVRNGLIDGNNSPSGVGVIVDAVAGKPANVVEDVDTVHMGNGGFSTFGSHGSNIFRRVRSRDNFCVGQDGRAKPSSGSNMFTGGSTQGATVLEQAEYYNACNPGNRIWPINAFTPQPVQLTARDFSPRTALKQTFCWE
jgi:hypothetical protein